MKTHEYAWDVSRVRGGGLVWGVNHKSRPQGTAQVTLEAEKSAFLSNFFVFNNRVGLGVGAQLASQGN